MIVVTELPYQVSPSSVLTKIKELVDAGELTGIADINNASSGEDVRLEIKLKKDAPALVILNNLYKRTPLQTNFAVNTVALIDGVPRTLNLVQALQAYVDHQADVIRRRSEFRLAKAKAREHIVEGLLKAIDMIDAIIALIRASADRAEAREGLMGRASSSARSRPTTSSTCPWVASPASAARSWTRSWASCARPSPSWRPSSPTRASSGPSSPTSWARSGPSTPATA